MFASFALYALFAVLAPFAVFFVVYLASAALDALSRPAEVRPAAVRLARVRAAGLGPARLSLVALPLVACAEPQDLPTEVKDLRVLAVAAEPPELLYDRAAGRFSEETVSFQALVADPRGGTATVKWSFCPVESDSACADFDSQREAAPAPLRPMLEALRRHHLDADARPRPEERGALVVDPFAVRLDPLLFDYHLAVSGLGMGNGAWMSAALAVEVGNDRVLAQKRVVIGARDLAEWNPELRARLGFTACAPDGSGDPGCLAVPARLPNRNPQIAELLVARSGRADAPFGPESPPLFVRPGEELRLLPVLAADAEERYFVLDAALDGNRIQVVEKREQAIVSWFATAGELASERTAAPLTKTLDNRFTVPETAAPGDAISVWMVVRDGRGGTGWRHVPVEVVAP